MLTELLKYSRKKVRRVVLFLLMDEGDHLDLSVRTKIVEDSLDALDHKCDYYRAQVTELTGCGHHSNEYGRQ